MVISRLGDGNILVIEEEVLNIAHNVRERVGEER
jgi:hypothetical protein